MPEISRCGRWVRARLPHRSQPTERGRRMTITLVDPTTVDEPNVETETETEIEEPITEAVSSHVLRPRNGDDEIRWDLTNPNEVAIARTAFDQFKADGFLAYSSDVKDGPAEVIQSFDPLAAEIVMTPQIIGG